MGQLHVCRLRGSWGLGFLSGSERPIFKVDLAHTSPITSKRCIQPHGECGRVVRWPSAPGWWCRRRRACHSSCNWGGMPGLAGPFHLHPAVRWETQKIQELIMSLLGFCSGWNHPPRSSSSSPGPLHAASTHPSPPTFFNSSPSLIPLFYLSITFPFTPLLFSHSLFSHPRLFHFTPSPTSLNIPLPTIIKHLTLGRAAPLLQPPAFTQSSLQPGYVRLSTGSWGPCDARALPVASIVQWFVCVIFGGYPWMLRWVAERIY